MTQIDIENVGQPGKTYRVDAVKYAEMKRAVLAILPKSAPGLTPAEVIEAVKPSGSNPLPRRRHRGLVGQISTTGP